MNMQMATTETKKVIHSYKCEYCSKTYGRENSLMNHTLVCEKRRRILAKDEPYSIKAFFAYQSFYENNYNSKKKTYADFISSRYYSAFIRFGRHITSLDVIYPEEFVKFLIKTRIPLDDWDKEYVYETYLRELNKKESGIKATERNILFMQKWGEETNNNWAEFFRIINPNLATHLIRNGKISPWIIFCSNSAQDLLKKLSEEQMKLVYPYVNPSFWSKRLKESPDDVAFIKNLLKEAGV